MDRQTDRKRPSQGKLYSVCIYRMSLCFSVCQSLFPPFSLSPSFPSPPFHSPTL